MFQVEFPFEQSDTFYPITRAANTPPDNKTCRVAGWGSVREVTIQYIVNTILLHVNKII